MHFARYTPFNDYQNENLTMVEVFNKLTDLYSGYNEYPTEFDTNDLENDKRLRVALRSSYARRPTAITEDSAQLTRRIVASTSNGDQFVRPITAVLGAGYTSQKTNTFDPLNLASKTPVGFFDSPKPITVEDKIKDLEKKIMELIDESCLAEAAGDLRLALEKAKEASSKEHSLIHLFEEMGGNRDDNHNFELTFCVLFTVAHQYVTNEMYVEALNMYQVISKNKVFQNGSRLKINMGNIYAELGQYQKAIKMYRWALDHVPNTNKDLRVKIMHNIGIIFIKMKMFDEACANFEYIMQEKPDLKAGFHAHVCYCIMGNHNMMKKSFEAMLNIPLESFELNNITFYNTFQNDPSLNMLYEVIKHDTLSAFEKRVRKEAESKILTAANLLARVIEHDYTAGYNRCMEMLKNCQYSTLTNDLEINKALTFLKSNDVTQAIDVLKSFDRKDSPVTSIASTNLSFIYFLRGDLLKAEPYGLSARSADVYNPSAYVNLGNCMFNRSEYYKAKEFYKQALESDSSCTEALYNLGLTNKSLGLLDEALDCFMKLKAIITSNTEVLYQIAHLYELLSESDQAIGWYIQLISIIPSDSGVLQKIGDIFDSENNKQQTLHYYLESYRYYPSNLAIIDWLGAHFVELRLTNKAIAFFEQAALIQPLEPKWKLLVGSCYRKAGNYQLALKIYKDTCRQFPDNIECLKLMVNIGTELELKETPQYIEKLKKARKYKELKERSNSGRSAAANNTSQAVDPLEPLIERPYTSAGNKSKQKRDMNINDDFGDEELTDDLLPE